MGKKSWFSAMKKALSPSTSKTKTKKEKRSNKSKSKSNPKNLCHVNQVSLDACSSQTQVALANPSHHHHSTKETEFIASENEQIIHVDSITYTTTVAQNAVVSHDKVNRKRSNSRFLGRTREEVGAIKIQAAYRGYMARRDFRSLRAMRRLNLWLEGQAIKRQTMFALMRIQTMSRVQSQVRVRRIRMAEVNEALQRQLIQKRLKIKQAFDLSPRSKEQVEASLRSKKEAVERRVKALAYAYSRQQMWRNAQSPKSGVVDPNHFDWDWSWSNRWDVIRPRETGTTSNVGPMIRQQSLPSKPLLLPNSMSSRAQILKAGLSRINTGYLTGIANKQHLVTSSSFSSAPRIAVR